MSLDINFFNKLKSEIIWEPIIEWVSGRGLYKHFAWKGLKLTNGIKGGVPFFFIYVDIDENNITSVSLYVNKKRDPKGKDMELIEKKSIGNKKDAINTIPKLLLEKYGLNIGGDKVFESYFYPNQFPLNISATPKTSSEAIEKVESKKFVNKDSLKAIESNIYKIVFYSKISKSFVPGYQIYTMGVDIQTNKTIPLSDTRNEIYQTYGKAESELTAKAYELHSDGFVEVSEWDNLKSALQTKWMAKELNMETYDNCDNVEDIVGGMETSYKKKTLEEMIEMRNKTKATSNTNSSFKIRHHSQSEWYAGTTPDPKKIEQYLGGPNVDASQIKSVFIGVDDAVSLVNRFDSSLLSSIGFIFNFSNQGAYGVYLPVLDDKIKREKIKSVLRQEGCKIEEKPDSSFVAYNESKSPEEIQKEIDTMDTKLNQEGGHVFGINMNKVLMASKADANAMNLTNQEDINDIITLHLGATIAHEAVHAKGNASEGPSEQAEQAFFSFALPIINQKRLDKHKSSGNTNEFTPLIITPYRRSASKGWYKTAQNAFPTGAQFGANMPEAYKQFSTFNNGLMFGDMGKAPIESMLEEKRDYPDSPTREFPLEKKISLVNAKLPAIKVDKEDFIMEVLLEKDRKEYQGYSSTEKLLEDRRPKPIILPKTASNNMKKFATLFGWMSNLDLPMRERIIPGNESDDFLAFDWDESDSSGDSNLSSVKKLPRYNYDGQMYYYVEPRFQAELWDQMISARPTSFINPARRFAQKKDPNYDVILNVLNIIESKIKTNKVRGTRLVCSEDVFPFIVKFFRDDEDVKVESIKKTKFDKHDDALIVWICRYSIPKSKIESAEGCASGVDKSKEAKDIFDFLMGDDSFKKDIIKTILSMAKNICQQYKIEDVFVVGGFPRSIAMKETWNNIHDLDFASAWPNQCIKLGGMLADTLKVEDTQLFHRTMTLSWEWMGIKCDFKGHFSPIETRDLLRKHNIKSTPLNIDIYGRDFTINMLIYDVNKEVIYDVCKQSVEDIKRKTIRTYFSDVENIVKNNPIIILRAMKYMIRYGFVPELELDKAMRSNKDLLFNGNYSKERIGIGFLELIAEDKEKANKTMDEYGLTEKCREYIKYANSN